MKAIPKKQPEREIKELFVLGAHLGHKKNRLHPKARKYIYKIINGVSIIDLAITVDRLTLAKTFLYEEAAQDKKLLVVVTKKIVNQYVAELCKQHDIPSITTKWLPGLLTNFTTIIKNVKKLQSLKEQKEQGEWEKFTKHERVKLDKQLKRLQRFYGGLVDLAKKPDILILVDSKKEKNALIEARRHAIPVVGVIDTNSNPEQIQYPIVINDDSSVVLQRVITELIQSYVKGKVKSE
ncbi:30S ribosomal protein S2 [Candidatus Roizmanbacteria bacterium]|nr:30S ribosomal protein S2 [Candidatus Roizmanbacteria bacterium]